MGETTNHDLTNKNLVIVKNSHLKKSEKNARMLNSDLINKSHGGEGLVTFLAGNQICPSLSGPFAPKKWIYMKDIIMHKTCIIYMFWPEQKIMGYFKPHRYI